MIDWIIKNENMQLLANLATIFGILFLAIQLFLLYRQIFTDNERARREKSVELIMQWSLNLNRRASISRKLVESLDENHTRCLWESQSFSIPESQKDIFKGCFEEDPANPTQNGNIIVTDVQSTEIRWQIVNYLNILESVLAAWRHNTANSYMIEEQFKYLFSKQHGHSALSKFRLVAGGEDNYPSITAFEAYVQERNKKELLKKTKRTRSL